MPVKVVGRRKKYLVDRHFQCTFILNFIGMVAASMLLSLVSIVSYYYVRYARGDAAMTMFYVTGQSGTGLQETNLLAVVVPALVVSAVLCVTFSAVFGLLYSHRIAGPLFNLRRVIANIRRGRFNQPVRFRKKDEFQGLAAEMSKTIAWLRRRLPAR